MEETLTTKAQLIPGDMGIFLNQKALWITNWQWLAILGSIFALWAFRPIIEIILTKIKTSSKWFREKNTFIKFMLEQPNERSISWIIICLIWLAIFDALGLPEKGHKYLAGVATLILSIHVMRIAYLAANATGDLLKAMADRTSSPMDDQLAPFATKVMKFLVVVIGILIILQSFDVKVMSLIAGLGLGGLALALAAQDTAANVFGSITILLDSPFKVGDLVRIGDTEGIVSDIGFRSTQIRTNYNSLVTIPNSVMAKEKIDNLERRNERRIRQVLGIAYETPPATISLFVDGIKNLLMAEPLVNKENIVVVFNNFNAASLDILTMFHIKTSDGPTEFDLTQKIFRQILELAAKLKVDFAYPTQTIYLKRPEHDSKEAKAPHIELQTT
ncbi:MAG: mechanosensitive ion channel domain-containing protein [Bdellovibrionota bacterium]